MDRGALALRISRQERQSRLMRAEQRARRDALLRRIGTRPLVMGILNVTPDSFSDGGRFQALDAAAAHAKQMIADGCDIVDIGGESTRPGAAPVAEAEELARIGRIVALLDGLGDTPVSIDTTKARVARAAVGLGAVLVNDVWGLQKDPAMADVVAEAQAAIVIVHNRPDKDEAIDIVADIRRFFDRSLALAEKAGIPRERIILDPGVGFAKTSRQNRDAVAGIAELADYRLPILIAASRKGFLGSTGGGAEASLIGTIAVNLTAAAAGAAIFRVHDVAEHVLALKVFHTIRTAWNADPPRDIPA
jgi:dihydropteroate synthase